VHAHLPARESQLKEPPYPRSKMIDKKKKDNDYYIDVEDKDPVWLKDKGDHFFKRADYTAALNAYAKAIKADPEFLPAKLNRATNFIKMRAPELCIQDCNEVIATINGMKDEEIEGDRPYFMKILARAHIKRGAAQVWSSQFDAAISDFNTVMENEEFKQLIGERELTNLAKDKARIQQRVRSNKLKALGDREFYHEKLNDAYSKYQEAIEEDDENEYALANMGVIHLKKLEYEQSIDFSTRAIEIINNFQNETKLFASQNVLEVKLLLRRAKSHEMRREWEKSKEDLDKILQLEPKNSEAQGLLKTITSKLDEILFTKYRDEANEHLKNKRFQQALDCYDKCLKVTRKATTLDNIAVYVNKIACLLSMDRLAQVVSECNEAIRLIKNFRNRFETKGPDGERLKGFELRVSIRRGNALGKLQRTSEAIAEYERALKIDPGNAAIEKDLQALRKIKWVWIN